jgi:CrcB protein
MMVIWVACGGAIGSVLRYLLMGRIAQMVGSAFPFGTLFVNISGSFLMGVVIGVLAKTSFASQELRAFLAVGILGGYTTFSTFSLDIMTLWQHGQVKQAVAYIISSVAFSIVGIVAGLFTLRCFW